MNAPDATRQTLHEAGEPPFFVFGCPRSGTSLLSRMLDQHPRIAIPNESHLFTRFYPLRNHYGDLSHRACRERMVTDMLHRRPVAFWSPRPDRDRVLASIGEHDFGGIVGALLGTWARDRGKARWGEKTPQHVRYWRQIRTCFPGAKAVHIIRDGRDVALSTLRASFGPKSVYAAAGRWAAYVQRVERLDVAGGSAGAFVLRYEDLLANPERELTRVCEFLGETFVPDMLEYHRDEGRYRREEVNAANLRRPLLRGNVEKWRTAMSVGEMRIFEAVAGRTLERYGYERVVPQATLSPMEEFFRRRVEAPLRKARSVAADPVHLVKSLDHVAFAARRRLAGSFRRAR
ncbi:MAG: sulfotransferase [Gemmatimonadota bacterium]